MTTKEKILEWLIRPERWYIRKYLRLLRNEEKSSGVMRYYYKARKNRLGSRLGFIISAGCFDEGLTIEHYGSIIVNPQGSNWQELQDSR